MGDVVLVKNTKSIANDTVYEGVSLPNIALCETITRVERDVITLRGEYTQDSEYLNRHVTTLTDNNSKLNVQLSKQSDRILNMQNQINLIRDGKFQKQLESLEGRFKNLEAKLCEYSNISRTITKLENSMSEISEIVKQTKETNVKNSKDLTNLKVNLTGVQSKLQSESARINCIQDQRYAAVSSLKSRVDLINDMVKDNEPLYERLETMTSSCTQSVTDIRKKTQQFRKES